MHKGFAWKRPYILLVAIQPGCVVSVFSDTLSVCVGLFLALTSVPYGHLLNTSGFTDQFRIRGGQFLNRIQAWLKNMVSIPSIFNIPNKRRNAYSTVD